MKNKKPLLSVVILTYNSSRTIEKCLKSLENQTNKNFEVLIVDDDSTDNTIDLIKRNLKNYPFKIRFFRNGLHNISRGRNIGIKNAKTKYVAFLDSDAYADENWIKKILLNFDKDKELVLVSGGEIQIFTNNFSKGVSINDRAIGKLTSNFWKMRGGNCAIDKIKLKNIYFNENFMHNEESEFIYRLENLGFRWAYNKNMIIHHESRNDPKNFLKQMYKYGMWRVYFSFYSKKFRLVDFYPSSLMLLTTILSFFNIYFLLIIPIFSLIESLFVLFYMKSKFKFLPYLFIGWLNKNIGWGFGVIKGLINILLNNKIGKLIKA